MDSIDLNKYKQDFSMAKVIGVIPSRMGSTRLPEKPLALINGKPLLQWVIEGSLTSKKIDQVLVATDDKRIAALAEKCGVQAVMTSPDITTGTDRVYAAIQNMDCDIVLNIQGDEPLIRGEVLDPLVDKMLADKNAQMGTLAHHFKSEADVLNINTAKVLLNHKNEAIYFSRFPIPFSRRQDIQLSGLSMLHVGIYAFRKNFLKVFCSTPPTAMEQFEGLEQLRALYLDTKIHVVSVDYETRGVDTAEDIKIVESIMKGSKI